MQCGHSVCVTRPSHQDFSLFSIRPHHFSFSLKAATLSHQLGSNEVKCRSVRTDFMQYWPGERKVIDLCRRVSKTYIQAAKIRLMNWVTLTFFFARRADIFTERLQLIHTTPHSHRNMQRTDVADSLGQIRMWMLHTHANPWHDPHFFCDQRKISCHGNMRFTSQHTLSSLP